MWVVLVFAVLLVIDHQLTLWQCHRHDREEPEPVDFSPAIGFTLETPDEEYEDGDQEVIGFRPSS